MPQQQVNIPLPSPGFGGLNTEDSPLTSDPSFCAVANNCTIDKLGRLSSRKGFKYLTTNPSVLGTSSIAVMGEFIKEDTGVSTIFACGNNKIFIQQTVAPFELVAQTLPAAYVVSDDNWQMAQLNDKMYFVQAGQEPLVYSGTWAKVTMTGIAGANGYPNCVHAAFGRLWFAGFSNNPTSISWSSILDGTVWNAGGSGSLQTSEYWPSGYGTITAITAHNNFLVIFGENNILVYNTTSDVVNSLRLSDTIEGIGCLARDSLAPTGEDFMFCDASGIRSLNRTLQDSTLPLNDVSSNIRSDIQTAIRNEETSKIKSVFHQEDSFYCCFFRSSNSAYVFDTWQPLQTGAFRATRWDILSVSCGLRTRNRTTFFGGSGGVYVYTGAEDVTLDSAGAAVTTKILMEYTSNPLNLGSPVNVLFPKQVDVTVIGGLAGTLTLNWGFNFNSVVTNSIEKNINNRPVVSNWTPYDAAVGVPSLLLPNPTGAVEWVQATPQANARIGEYGVTNELTELKYNVWGSGRNISIGFTSNITGSLISIQEINIQALQGRIL
tara:strand:- start:19468 stop:21111 length:1644 start_codon:yes stop_codon:yes gene_type:complete